MRLQRIGIHRLTRVLTGILPAAVAVLIAIPAWDYWGRDRDDPQEDARPGEFPPDVAIHTEKFRVTRSVNGKPEFTVSARTTLGFKDERQLLQGVEVVIFGQAEGDPDRRIQSDECSFHEQSGEIACDRNVHIQLDENTFGHTEHLTYEPSGRSISTTSSTTLEQPGQMTGAAGRLDYSMVTGLLRLAGDVNVQLTEGGALRAGTAIFQKKENWAIVSDNVELQSINGRVTGGTGRAELEPDSYRPRRVTMEGNIVAESGNSDAAESWTLQTDWLQSDISTAGAIEHVIARGRALMEEKTTTGKQTLRGGEIEAQVDPDGRARNVEARMRPEFSSADRSLTAESRISLEQNGETIRTEGASTLIAGQAARITGRNFTIEEVAGSRIFRTSERAAVTAGDRRTEADSTTIRFDLASNTIRELDQTGRFIFDDGKREGSAGKARITNDGKLIELEVAPRITDPETSLTANRIVLDTAQNRFTGFGNVRTETRGGQEPSVVLAGRVEGSADEVEYWERVIFSRAITRIEADHLRVLLKENENQLIADGKVSSRSGGFQAWADSLDFRDSSATGQNARYQGNVRAEKRDQTGILILTTDDMNVRLKEGVVDVIEARGSVDIKRGVNRGQGAEAVYNAVTGHVVLTGSANADAVVTGTEGVARGHRIETDQNGKAVRIESSRANGGAVSTGKPTN